MKKVNDFFSKRLSPVLANLVLARKQRGCLRLINCCIGRFYGRCPNPQFLKKLSKLFCFWEDNLALAKFQSPTDTPLNHNLPQLLTKNHKKISTMRLMHRAFVYHSVTSLINILSLYLPFLLALASLNLSSSPSVIPLALAMA